jgi:signal transduction histidine kinase
MISKMQYKRTLIIFIFLLYGFAVNAQWNNPDAIHKLEKKLDQTSDPVAKLNMLSNLSDYYQTADPKLAKKYEDIGLTLAKQLKRDSDACMFYGYIGETYMYAGDIKNGLIACDLEFELAKKHGYKTIESQASSDIGMAYQFQGNYPLSQDYFFRALTFAEEIKNRRLIGIYYVNISSNFFNEDNTAKTIFYANKSVEACKGLNVNCYTVISKADELTGSSYLKLGKFAVAQDYYARALKIYQQNNDANGQATIYTLMVTAYPADVVKQLDYGLKAQAIWDRMGPGNSYAISNLGNIGSAYATMAKQQKNNSQLKNSLFDKAETYISKAIKVARDNDSKQNIIFFTDSLSVVEAERGKFKNAYTNLVSHNQLADSVYSQENKNKIAALEGKHDLALKEQEFRINKLEVANQQKQKWLLLAGLLTFIIIAGLVLFQSRQRKKANTTLLLLNNELDEANKIKTKFFSILNHDLRSPVASFVNFLHLQQNAPDLIDKDAGDAYSKSAVIAAENLLSTMEDLLLWSKGQMENFKPSSKILTVKEIFDHIQAAVNPPNNIRISFEQQPGMVLNVDEHYLKTIMLNLTNNAIKALGKTSNGAITWKAWEQGSQKYLSVTDNGPGATQEAFKALYDDAAPIGIKSGLGLHIVRDLAKAIGCHLSVNLKHGSGVELQLKFS